MEFLNPPFLISILIALSVHEWAHAYMANRLGDPTPQSEGRLTLNPIAHLDPLGTILFLVIGFGWGKPVPVNPHYFRHPKRDTALVALAGPMSNIVLAFIAFGALLLLSPESMSTSAWDLVRTQQGGAFSRVLVQICTSSIFLNLGLMAFNLLPIAPLDGSKIFHFFVPYQYEDVYENLMQKGPFILLGLLIIERVLNIPVFFGWIFGVMSPFLWIMDKIASVVV